MTNRQLYMEKRKEVHAPEEFLAAFEDNTAICSSQSVILVKLIMRKRKYGGIKNEHNSKINHRKAQE